MNNQFKYGHLFSVLAIFFGLEGFSLSEIKLSSIDQSKFPQALGSNFSWTIQNTENSDVTAKIQIKGPSLSRIFQIGLGKKETLILSVGVFQNESDLYFGVSRLINNTKIAVYEKLHFDGRNLQAFQIRKGNNVSRLSDVLELIKLFPIENPNKDYLKVTLRFEKTNESRTDQIKVFE